MKEAQFLVGMGVHGFAAEGFGRARTLKIYTVFCDLDHSDARALQLKPKP